MIRQHLIFATVCALIAIVAKIGDLVLLNDQYATGPAAMAVLILIFVGCPLLTLIVRD